MIHAGFLFTGISVKKVLYKEVNSNVKFGNSNIYGPLP